MLITGMKNWKRLFRSRFTRPALRRATRRRSWRKSVLSADVATTTEQLENRTLLAANLLANLDTTTGVNADQFVQVGAETFFVAVDDVHGRELWKTDGTIAGTQMVLDINPSTVSSSPEDLVRVGDTLYFTAEDGSLSGRQLWKSDGTSAGTTHIIVFEPFVGPAARLSNLTKVDDILFFSGDIGGIGIELLKFDTVTNTSGLVKNIFPAQGASSRPSELADANGTLYFSAFNNSPGELQGRELWKSNGTEAGTNLVVDLNEGTFTCCFPSRVVSKSTNPQQITPVGNQVFFTTQPSNDLILLRDVWVTNGTEAGTLKVSSNINVDQLTAFDGKLYFVTRSGDGYVFKLGDKFELLARNRFDTRDEFSATPAVSDGQLFIRANRTLFCVAKTD